MFDSLFPRPKKITALKGKYICPNEPHVLFDRSVSETVLDAAERYEKKTGYTMDLLPGYAGEIQRDITLSFDETVPEQGFVIRIEKNGISLLYSDEDGLFYGLNALITLISQPEPLMCAVIEDSPDILHRGFMMDISRDRVPTLQAMFEWVDLLADLRYNELQLYLEQPAVEYAAFPHVTDGNEPLTRTELLKIIQYAKKKHITLTPNQNCFGHSQLWLIKPECKGLATTEFGYVFNPLLEKTYDTLGKMMDSLCACYEGTFFHAGCDEVSELMREDCVTYDACKERGVENVIGGHLAKLHDMLAKRGRRMMIWHDTAYRHPVLLDTLPKDIVMMIWGYEADSDLDTPASVLAGKGFDFYACPSTGAFANITGKPGISERNVLNAVDACVKHNGKGVLLTDWGDMGSVAFSVVTRLQTAYCAGVCWDRAANEDDRFAKKYCNETVFGTTEDYTDLLIKLSDVYPSYGIMRSEMLDLIRDTDDCSAVDSREACKKALKDLRSLSEKNSKIELRNPIYNEEFACACLCMEVLLNLRLYKFDIAGYGKIPSFESKMKKTEALVRRVEVLYRAVWAKKNKLTGCGGFWWFVDRQIAKLYYYQTGDEKYTYLLHDHKERSL